MKQRKSSLSFFGIFFQFHAVAANNALLCMPIFAHEVVLFYSEMPAYGRYDFSPSFLWLPDLPCRQIHKGGAAFLWKCNK